MKKHLLTIALLCAVALEAMAETVSSANYNDGTEQTATGVTVLTGYDQAADRQRAIA